MCDNERTKINELRKQGFGYKKIAKELSITPSAVRYACGLMGEKDLLFGYL